MPCTVQEPLEAVVVEGTRQVSYTCGTLCNDWQGPTLLVEERRRGERPCKTRPLNLLPPTPRDDHFQKGINTCASGYFCSGRRGVVVLLEGKCKKKSILIKEKVVLGHGEITFR